MMRSSRLLDARTRAFVPLIFVRGRTGEAAP